MEEEEEGINIFIHIRRIEKKILQKYKTFFFEKKILLLLPYDMYNLPANPTSTQISFVLPFLLSLDL